PWLGSMAAKIVVLQSQRFNGSTVLEPWLGMALEADRIDEALASMGPRFSNRGWVGAGGYKLSRKVSFNGSTVLEPWLGRDWAVEPQNGVSISFNGSTVLEPWLGAD